MKIGITGSSGVLGQLLKKYLKNNYKVSEFRGDIRSKSQLRIWIKKFGISKLTNADKIHEHGIYLPNNYDLTYNEIKYIAYKFREVAIPYKF